MTISTHDLTRSFGGVRAVDSVTLTFRPQSLTAVIGPNGAGKSTLFNLLAGADRPDSGEVLVAGESIARRKMHRMVDLGVARTFQLTRVWHELTVLENILVASRENPDQRFSRALFPRRSRREHERARAVESLARVGLAHKSDELAGNLSGGQRKLLELARALHLDPTYLLLDEPLAGVAPALGRQLLALVRHLVDDEGVTAVFIEHDIEAVLEFSHEVVVMARGGLIAQGTPDEIVRDDQVASAYLGGTREERTR